ncbi:MAG: biosynthetic peptidoglycan transglycosylase [Kofleriaceae bacterium]
MRLAPVGRPGKRAARPNQRRGGKAPSGPAWLRSRWFRFLKWSAVVGLCLMAILSVVVALVFWSYGRDLPRLDSLGDYKPKEVTIIEDRDGQRIGELYAENSRRTFVPYAELPRMLVDAVVATEDEHFWTHGGIDYRGMIRAFFVNLRSGDTRQGASTITQQVVKTFVLSPEKTFKRKIQEIILARRLESELSKEEILTLYLNQIYFGHGRYGVQEAARFYFGKDVGELDVGQMAMLAGLPQSPENLSPRKHPAAAKTRQAHVLGRLAATGKLTRDEAKRWIDAPIALVATPFPRLGAAPEWVGVGREELLRGKGTAGKAALLARGAESAPPSTSARRRPPGTLPACAPSTAGASSASRSPDRPTRSSSSWPSSASGCPPAGPSTARSTRRW